MKFYLFKDEPVHISRPAETWKEVNAEITTTVTRLTPILSEKESKDGEYWDSETVTKCSDALIAKLKDQNQQRMETKLVIWMLDEDDGRSALFGTRNNRLFLSVRLLELEGSFLKRVRQICGDSAKLSFELFFTPPNLFPALAGVVAMDLELDEDITHTYTLCSARHMPVTPKMEEHWKKLKEANWRVFGDEQFYAELLKARCNVILQVKDDSNLFADILSYQDANYRLFHEAQGSDFEVVTAAGAVIKCHKTNLMAGSRVLYRKISESNINRLKIRDMSEAGVRAFIFYLYYGEQNEPGWNFDVAVELFKAGYKYDINNNLQRRIQEYLLQTPDVRVSLDQAIRLLPHVINKRNETALEAKLMGILHQEDIATNERYQQFFREHPEILNTL